MTILKFYSMSRSLALAAILILIFSHTAYNQQNGIYGKWYFDRFGGPHGEIVKDGEIAKANKMKASRLTSQKRIR